MKRTVVKVSNENAYEFMLFGIVCQLPDFRLARELNLHLNIQFKRMDDYNVFNNKRMEERLFAFFEYAHPEGERYHLISNKSEKGLLIPEQSQIDYLFIIHPATLQMDENEVLAEIKQIPAILGAYRLFPEKLKSKENLIF